MGEVMAELTFFYKILCQWVIETFNMAVCRTRPGGESSTSGKMLTSVKNVKWGFSVPIRSL